MMNRVKTDPVKKLFFICCALILFWVSPFFSDSMVMAGSFDFNSPQISVFQVDYSLNQTQLNAFNGIFHFLDENLLNSDDNPDNLKILTGSSEKVFPLTVFFILLCIIFIYHANIFHPSPIPRSPPRNWCLLYKGKLKICIHPYYIWGFDVL